MTYIACVSLIGCWGGVPSIWIITFELDTSGWENKQNKIFAALKENSSPFSTSRINCDMDAVNWCAHSAPKRCKNQEKRKQNKQCERGEIASGAYHKLHSGKYNHLEHNLDTANTRQMWEGRNCACRIRTSYIVVTPCTAAILNTCH